MSKFSLGGVPHYATDAFYKLRDATDALASDGQDWVEAVELLLDLEDPKEAIKLLKKGKKRKKPRSVYSGGGGWDIPG